VKTAVTGIYSKRTIKAVRKFQRRSRLPRRGVVNKATWKRLLAFEPKPVRWSLRRRSRAAAPSSHGGREPRSATLPARRYEIPPGARSGG
jgi:peptidoglycan hydrolase-like protein with peptidoglycan-binding domain